jgi:copper transport protein
LRLVFSEPLERAYSNIDLLDAEGRVVSLAIGAPDPAEPRSLVVPVAGIANGVYTVNWRALSAADGHDTSGTFTFGIGVDALPPGVDRPDRGGELHGGHTAGHAATETQGRTIGYAGFMLALGLGVIAWLVIRPVAGHVPEGAVVGGLLGLAGGAIGAALLVALALDSAEVELSGYLTASRTGQLLLGRIVVALVGFLIAAVLLRTRRVGAALGVVAGAGLIGIVLTALGGHAAAFASPAPLVSTLVHIVSGAVWLAGVVALAWFATAGRRAAPVTLGAMIPRFSALALVSIALVGLTGTYAAWVELGDLGEIDTAYGGAVIVKVVVFAVAIALGAFNYLSGEGEAGGTGSDWLRRRLGAEAMLAIAVIVATANLASGSPPGSSRPVGIAPAASAIQATEDIALALQPGRPGPNRYEVAISPAPASGAQVELQLDRIDQAVGSGRVVLRAASAPDGAARFVSNAGALPAESTWDASVIVRDASGTEVSRQRFSFALDAVGVSSGRSAPAIDPGFLVALALVALGVLGLAYLVGGGRLPRVEPAASKVALAVGSPVAAVLGVVLLVGGPR